MQKVERRIMFFFADVGEDEAGDPLPFDEEAHLKALSQLQGGDRYYSLADGRVVCAWATPKEGRLRVGNIRRNDLPQVEQDGKLKGLGLPADAGLAEQMHVVFFDDNIVGADFNFYGPRMSSVATYLKLRGNAPANLSFDPLVLQDIGPLIARINEVTMFRLRIRPSFMDELKKADETLHAAFEAAEKVSDAGEIELVVRIKPHARDGMLSKGLKAIVNKLRRSSEIGDQVSKFVIGGRDETGAKVEDVDILKNLITASKKVLKSGERTRAVQAESAFEAIEQARDELREQIAAARRLSKL
jgi:hypothetical protein